jgi:sarcosine oxidase, subunit beta
VLDRAGRPGEGSTGRATGGFRAQFATEVNVRLSLLSREKLLRFADETGVDPCFRQSGYLLLAREGRLLEALREAQALQHACGLAEARAVTPEEAGELNPAAECRGLAGGVFCPTDGFMRPLEILRGYAEAAARRGVRVEYGAEVLGFEKDGRGRGVGEGGETSSTPRARGRPASRGSRAWSFPSPRCAGRWPSRSRATCCRRGCR